MAAVMLQANPSFSAEYSEKNLITSANTYKKNCLQRLLCSLSNDKTCFVSNCKLHIILLGNVEELLRKFDIFCFTYQHVYCLYTLFRYRFSGEVIAKSGQEFGPLQRAVDFNHRNKGMDRRPSIAKKRLLGKNSRSIYSAPFRRQGQRRSVVQCLQKHLTKTKRLILSWI